MVVAEMVKFAMRGGLDGESADVVALMLGGPVQGHNSPDPGASATFGTSRCDYGSRIYFDKLRTLTSYTG